MDQRQPEEPKRPRSRLVVEERDNFIRNQEQLLSPRTRQIYEERVSLRARALEIDQTQPASSHKDDWEQRVMPMDSSHTGQFNEMKAVLGLPIPRPAMSKMSTSGYSEALNMQRLPDEEVHSTQKDVFNEGVTSTGYVGLPLPRPAMSQTSKSAYSEALNMQRMLDDQDHPGRKDDLSKTNDNVAAESIVLPLPRPTNSRPENAYSEALKMQTFLNEQVGQVRASVRDSDQGNLSKPEELPALPCPRPAVRDLHHNSEELERKSDEHVKTGDLLNVGTDFGNKSLTESPQHPHLSRKDETVYSEALKMQELLEKQSHRLGTSRKDHDKVLNQKSRPASSSSNQINEKQVEEQKIAANFKAESGNSDLIVSPIKPKENEVLGIEKAPKVGKDPDLRQENEAFREALRLQELLEEQSMLRSSGTFSAKNSSVQANQRQHWPTFLQNQDTSSWEKDVMEKNLSSDQIFRENVSSVGEPNKPVQTSGQSQLAGLGSLSPEFCRSVTKPHLDFEEERAHERQLEESSETNVGMRNTLSPTSEREQEWNRRKRQHAPGDGNDNNSKALCKEKAFQKQFNPGENISQYQENALSQSLLSNENPSVSCITLTLDRGPKTPEPEMQLILPQPTHSSYEVNPRQSDPHSMSTTTTSQNKDTAIGFDWDLLKQDQLKESTSSKPETAKNRLKNKAANFVQRQNMSNNPRTRTPDDEMQVILPKPTYSSANNAHSSKTAPQSDASVSQSKESGTGFDWDLLKQNPQKESNELEEQKNDEGINNERTRTESEASLSSFSSLSIISGSSSIVELSPLRVPQSSAEQHPSPVVSRRRRRRPPPYVAQHSQPPPHFFTQQHVRPIAPPSYGGLPHLPVVPPSYGGLYPLPIMPQFTNDQLCPQPDTHSSTVQWEAQTEDFLKSIGAKAGRHSREKRRSPTRKKSSERARSRSRERRKSRDKGRKRDHHAKPSSSKSREKQRVSLEKAGSSTSTKAKQNVKPKSSLAESQRRSQEKAEPENKAEKLCVCCLARTHDVKDCPKFSGLGVNERWTIVRNLSVKLCVKCLDVGHFVEECDVKKETRNRWSEVCCDRYHALMHICNIKPNENKPVFLNELLLNGLLSVF